MGKLKPINPTKAQIVANPQAHDYDNLTHKPQINGHELVGDKSSDDLGLQGKLTAGENVTIDENGRISASGGVTSYSDLTDKPQINGITLLGNKKNSDLGFSNFYYSESNPPMYIPSAYGSGSSLSSIVDYQLNDIWINTNTNTAFRLGYKDNNELLWYPLRVKVFLSDGAPPQSEIPQINEKAQVNSLIHNVGDIWIHRTYNSGSTRPFYELNGLYICVGSAKQSQPPLYQYNITWARLDNKVRSGVVNSNGSITFTNSDGTTFTTSGTSVIGADGFSPTATVTQTQNGATVSITDKNGTTTANISNGADGQDYVLTPRDKSDIADLVLEQLPTTQGVLYGNSND